MPTPPDYSKDTAAKLTELRRQTKLEAEAGRKRVRLITTLYESTEARTVDIAAAASITRGRVHQIISAETKDAK